MFFFGIMGISSAVKEAGSFGAVCPLCGGQRQMHLVRSFSYFHFFFIPIFRFDQHYYATCPGCAGVFEVSKAVGESVRRGETAAVSAGELQTVKNNMEGLCPGCGHRNPAGSTYCNRCGRAL